MFKISEPKIKKVYRITEEIEGIKYLAVISFTGDNNFIDCKFNFKKPYSLTDFKFLSILDKAFQKIKSSQEENEYNFEKIISEEENFQSLNGPQAFQCISDIKKVFRDFRKTESLSESSILETNTFKLIEDSIFNILEDLSVFY